jgi:DNA-binding CsgD family transcriptional regulator
VEAQLANGDHAGAASAVDELVRCARDHPGPYLRATAALARGRLCLAETTGDPCGCLREARSGFTQARTPLELAQARFELARALASDQPAVAVSEARAALDGFERLSASRQADAVAALLRSLGSRERSPRPEGGVLTRRESEVLELLGQGLSNPEIANRLYISRKTVEHHVSHILAKLGLRSRAEAAVYATREKPASR